MNTGRDVERLIADWFVEEAVLRAPDRILDAAGRGVDRTTQRRPGAALSGLFTSAPLRVAAAALLGVLVVGGAFLVLKPDLASVGTRPTASPTPTGLPSLGPLSETYTSNRNGYTIVYPSKWTVVPATANWVHGAAAVWGDPVLDVLQGPKERLVAASQPWPGVPDAWYQSNCTRDHHVAACPNDQLGSTLRIGGQTGRLYLDGAAAPAGTIEPGGPIFTALVTVDQRAYEFTLDGDVTRDEIERLLETVSFFTPSFTRPDACDLVTHDDAQTIAGDVELGAPPTASGSGDETSCVYSDQGGNVVLRVTYTKAGGGAAFDQVKASAGVQPIATVGSPAVFDPASGALYVRRGDSLVSIVATIAAQSPAERLWAESYVARIAAERM